MHVGYAENGGKRSKTHIFDEGRPVCGAHVEGDYHQISTTMWTEKLECKSCRRFREREYQIQLIFRKP
jgi:uncharacterized GH25 family protein